MPRSFERPSERAELLATLQHGLGRTLALAERLSRDPLVGGEALAYHGRLEAIQAEVELMAACAPRPKPNDDEKSSSPASIWQ